MTKRRTDNFFRPPKHMNPPHTSPLLSFLILSFGFLNAQPPLQQEAVTLNAMLQKYHVAPKPCDDVLSKQIFEACFYLLDPQGVYFTQQDIQSLAPYQTQIDDNLSGKKWDFLPALTQLYSQKLKQQLHDYQEILSQPFDFNLEENMDFPSDKLEDSPDFPENEADRKQKIYARLKYQTLRNMLNQAAEDAPDSVILASETEVRTALSKRLSHRIENFLNPTMGFDNAVGGVFFEAITHCFDPHTQYLSKADRQSFMKGLSKTDFTFGLVVRENHKGELEIEKLQPGGAAWNAGVLNEGDVLISIKPENQQIMYLADVPVEELNRILDDAKVQKITLTLRKANNKLETVTLKKTKLIAEENIVKSLIIKGERKIGYILLPGFYLDSRFDRDLGCANDVAREIVKLKKEGMEGLILDIRYNGGGALHEGLDLSGIFVNEGPLSVIRMKENKPRLKLDPNRGTMWDGPLVVMVNGQSASASEMLAAALKDYRRAILVGSKTFGKATGQVMIPLDSTKKDKWGSLLVTIEKLYRVTGKSLQAQGLEPDICLPDFSGSGEYQEGKYRYVLPNDSIIKEVRYTPLPDLPIAQLSAQSRVRLQNHSGFQAVQSFAEFYAIEKENRTVPLNYFAYKALLKDKKDQFDQIQKHIDAYKPQISIENTAFDKTIFQQNPAREEVNQAFIKEVKSDMYVEECYHILLDWLKN